eukprot:6482364-Amphidinium_carterae.1
MFTEQSDGRTRPAPFHALRGGAQKCYLKRACLRALVNDRSIRMQRSLYLITSSDACSGPLDTQTHPRFEIVPLLSPWKSFRLPFHTASNEQFNVQRPRFTIDASHRAFLAGFENMAFPKNVG